MFTLKALGFVILILISTGLQAQQEKLFWADEFNGSGAPDPANWSYDTGYGNNGWGNMEIQNYTNLQQNVRQDSGKLIIQALKQGNTWTSARIITKNKFNFTYGRVVFSARLPVGSGTWPALWMLGESISTLGWPACGEVDVMEHVGKAPGVIHASVHTPSSYGNTINSKTINVTDVSTQFHEYEANWTPEKIDFSIDGTLFYSYNPLTKTPQTWPFNNPLFLIINVAMGGNFGSDPRYETGGLKNGIDPALTSARMEVDYVRVYKISYPFAIGENQDGSGYNPVFTPNPTTGKILISLPAGRPARGDVYNLIGIKVYHFENNDNTTQIDLSLLPKGIYFLAITSAGENKIQKIVLN